MQMLLDIPVQWYRASKKVISIYLQSEYSDQYENGYGCNEDLDG